MAVGAVAKSTTNTRRRILSAADLGDDHSVPSPIQIDIDSDGSISSLAPEDFWKWELGIQNLFGIAKPHGRSMP